jgi:hypothetical protein
LRLPVQKLAVLRDIDITSVLPREELARPDLQNTAKAVDKHKYEHDAEWCRVASGDWSTILRPKPHASSLVSRVSEIPAR